MKKLKDIIRFDNEWSEDVKNSNLEKLTGSIYMSPGEDAEFDFNWGGEFFFDCGPEVKVHALSDCIDIDSYLKEICENLNIYICTGRGENCHSLEVDTLEEGKQQYELIKKQIKLDGFNVFDNNE
jgi:hypothetical protein